MLNFRNLLLTVLALFISTVLVVAQKPPPPRPPLPLKASRTVGEASVYYLPKQNRTTAKVYLYILGEVAEIYEKKDVLTMEVGYEVAGEKAVEPKTVYLFLTSYSGAGLKYKDNHKITIYLDNKPLLSEDAISHFSNSAPQKISEESFALPKIEYKIFRKLVEAKKVTIQINKNKVELKSDTIEALKNLNNTIEP